jgi:NADH:ubiquinone oxidoreductase subunit 2 (subunit N)
MDIISLKFTILDETYSYSFFTQINKIIIITFTIILFIFFPTLLRVQNYINIPELPILLLINTALISTMLSANHYIVFILALEGFSLVLYILTTIDRVYGGIIAAAKYYIFGTLGSIFIFWGIVHIYAYFPTLVFTKIIFLNSFLINNFIINNSLEFANSLILFGLLIKLGAAPLHQWVADVYSGVHLLITAYYSIIVKFVIFTLLTFVTLFSENTTIIFIFSICSLLIGTIKTIQQLEIKRFLAFSSITHVGFLLIGDITASFTYILTYMCATLLFFSIFLSTLFNNKEYIYFSDTSILKNYGY